MSSLSSFKWKQLHRPLPPLFSTQTPFLTSLTPLSSLPHCHFVPLHLPLPHHALSFSFSVLPGYRRVKGMLRTPQQTLDSFISTKNKHTCITSGAREKTLKKKKSCNNETRTPWREYEIRYCLKQLLYSRFHNGRVLFQQSAVDQGESYK